MRVGTTGEGPPRHHHDGFYEQKGRPERRRTIQEIRPCGMSSSLQSHQYPPPPLIQETFSSDDNDSDDYFEPTRHHDRRSAMQDSSLPANLHDDDGGRRGGGRLEQQHLSPRHFHQDHGHFEPDRNHERRQTIHDLHLSPDHHNLMDDRHHRRRPLERPQFHSPHHDGSRIPHHDRGFDRGQFEPNRNHERRRTIQEIRIPSDLDDGDAPHHFRSPQRHVPATTSRGMDHTRRGHLEPNRNPERRRTIQEIRIPSDLDFDDHQEEDAHHFGSPPQRQLHFFPGRGMDRRPDSFEPIRNHERRRTIQEIRIPSDLQEEFDGEDDHHDFEEQQNHMHRRSIQDAGFLEQRQNHTHRRSIQEGGLLEQQHQHAPRRSIQDGRFFEQQLNHERRRSGRHSPLRPDFEEQRHHERRRTIQDLRPIDEPTSTRYPSRPPALLDDSFSSRHEDPMMMSGSFQGNRHQPPSMYRDPMGSSLQAHHLSSSRPQRHSFHQDAMHASWQGNHGRHYSEDDRDYSRRQTPSCHQRQREFSDAPPPPPRMQHTRIEEHESEFVGTQEREQQSQVNDNRAVSCSTYMDFVRPEPIPASRKSANHGPPRSQSSRSSQAKSTSLSSNPGPPRSQSSRSSQGTPSSLEALLQHHRDSVKQDEKKDDDTLSYMVPKPKDPSNWLRTRTDEDWENSHHRMNKILLKEDDEDDDDELPLLGESFSCSSDSGICVSSVQKKRHDKQRLSIVLDDESPEMPSELNLEPETLESKKDTQTPVEPETPTIESRQSKKPMPRRTDTGGAVVVRRHQLDSTDHLPEEENREPKEKDPLQEYQEYLDKYSLPDKIDDRKYLEQDQQEPSPKEDSEPNMIEIAPGITAPLRRTRDTIQAIARDFYRPMTCIGCQLRLYGIADIEYLLCPSCQIMSNVSEDDGREHCGLGLGVTKQVLLEIQDDLRKEKVEATCPPVRRQHRNSCFY